MFHKYAFLYLSLLCINIYSMDDSVVLNQTHIPHDTITYIEAITDFYEEMGIDFNQAIKYEAEFKNQIDKPIFAKIIELLSRSINIINNRPVSQIVNRDWCNVLEYIEGEKLSIDELVSILEVIGFLRIPLLEKPILISLTHMMVGMLNANQYKTVMKALSIVSTDYKNELKHLLYDYYPFDVWLGCKKILQSDYIYLGDDRYTALCTDDRNHIVAYSHNILKIMTRNKKLLHTIRLGHSFGSVGVNNNYIIALTDSSTIQIWDIKSGKMVKEILSNAKLNIIYIDEQSFGYNFVYNNSNKTHNAFYNFDNLDILFIEASLDCDAKVYMQMNNRRILVVGRNCLRRGFILGHQDQISLDFTLSGYNENTVNAYDQFKYCLPKVNARNFFTKYMRVICSLSEFKTDLCDKSECMGNDEIHVHFKDPNDSDIAISKLPGDSSVHTCHFQKIVSEKNTVHYNEYQEQLIIYYIHDNNLIDILNTVYPDNSICSVM